MVSLFHDRIQAAFEGGFDIIDGDDDGNEGTVIRAWRGLRFGGFWHG